MIKWEYKIVKMYMPDAFLSDEEYEFEEMQTRHQKVLNQLGEEYWEVWNVIGAYWYFKRPNPDQMQDPDAYFQYRTS